jgi:hypothetical protein
MTGRFEPDCKCKPSPMPQINHLQVENIPLDIEFVILCGLCKKPWKETCVIEEKK